MRGKRENLRVDVLPERHPYRDDGCDVSSSCLRCPLPQCKYDVPNSSRRARRDRRDAEIAAARRRERLVASALARRFGVSERTVWRALERQGQREERRRAA